jgi:hypothetical protein
MGQSPSKFQPTSLDLTQAVIEELCPYGQPDDDQDPYWLCCKPPPRAVNDSPVSSTSLDLYSSFSFYCVQVLLGPLSFSLLISHQVPQAKSTFQSKLREMRA